MRYPQVVPSAMRGGAVTIGNFDGVHRGHERVLECLRKVAGVSPAVLVTFYPHPIRVLRPDVRLRYISSVREKAEACAVLRVDLVYFIHFSRAVAAMSAEEFIERVLVNGLAAKHLVVGEDVAIGRDRRGNLDFLRQALPRHGITLHPVQKLEIDGFKAGSRRIRELIEGGDVQLAATFIGRPFTISARVGHGDKRGSAIGFPTANIAVGNRLIPKRGVYACRVLLDGSSFMAVANIGTRPTFNGSGERLEVHILDFELRSLYGTRIHVAFIARLRDETRFESIAALRSQIALDVAEAREVLNRV